MSQDDGLDLSPLDPMEDPGHWQAVVDATMARVDAALARRSADPIAVIAAWRRPLLMAAAITFAVLVPVELVLETRETRQEQIRRLVSLSSDLDEAATPPSGAEFLRALAPGRTP